MATVKFGQLKPSEPPNRTAMKNASATLFTLLATLCVFGCSSSAQLGQPQRQQLQPHAAPHTLRKPFVSRAESAGENFQRFKRQLSQTAEQFQNFLNKAKSSCAADMGFQPEDVQKSLLYAENPTPKEKCLIECILKRTDVMTSDNKLSSRSIGRIAEMVSNNNALVVSIAVAKAENCNRAIVASEPCEAAYQISKCMANEMRANNVKIIY